MKDAKEENNRPEKDAERIMEDIIHNYKKLEKAIVSRLAMHNKQHPSTTGRVREKIWEDLLKDIIPQKFSIEHSVFIIDSKRHVSKEIDLAIIDTMYTPYIFRDEGLKYIPIEAVAVVVECKSSSYKKDKMFEWCNAIRRLETDTNSVARLAQFISCGPAPTQKMTRPIMIYCGFKKTKGNLELENQFDFRLFADVENDKLEICVNKELNLIQWFERLNHNGEELITGKNESEIEWGYKDFLVQHRDTKLDAYSVQKDGEEISLLSFNFQINQLLMLINNPLLFPHLAYVRLFNQDRDEGVIN